MEEQTRIVIHLTRSEDGIWSASGEGVEGSGDTPQDAMDEFLDELATLGII